MYAFEICDSAHQPSISNYYKKVSAKKFIVNLQPWHNSGKCYVMQGMHTPTSTEDRTKGPFVDSLIKRIDRENVWSFANNAMWWPDNDNPGANDTPLVWIFVVWPEPYGGGWGQAPGGMWANAWLIPTSDSLYNPASHTYKKVYAHIFGISRQPSTHAGDATAGVVHEINHQWCPDIGYDPDHYGLGGFDPECAGLGFYDAQGGLPSPLNPVWRSELGWIKLVNPGASYNKIIPDQTSDTAFLFPAGGQSKFVVSVHRQLSYYESKWPGQGVLIWHTTGGSTLYDSDPAWHIQDDPVDTLSYLKKPIDLECAHGRWSWSGLEKTFEDPVKGRDNLDKRGYYTEARGFKGAGDSTCFFNPVYDYTQFDGITNPSSRGWNTLDRPAGDYTPQRFASRNIALYGTSAMKADFLYRYCIASNYPGIAIHSGANNQRSLVWLRSWVSGVKTHRNLAVAYVDNDPMLWIRVGEFENLIDEPRRLVYQGDSVSYPSLFSFGQNNNQIAVCWLDGSSLCYRYGVIEGSYTTDTIRWITSVDTISDIGSWPGFTAPSIVVRQYSGTDTVFVAAGASYTTYLPSGQGRSYFPILCFKFHKWHPEAAVVDTLAMFEVDTVRSLGIGSTVSLAVDERGRVHAAYVTNTSGSGSQYVGHRYLVPGDTAWNTEVHVIPDRAGYTDVGSPCLDYYDGYLWVVASANHEARTHTNVYRAKLNVSGSTIPSQWYQPSQVTTDVADSYEPVIAGGGIVFWSQSVLNGKSELYYRNGPTGPITNLSNTPHAWSNSAQAAFDEGICYTVWRESNSLGSELDLRSISTGGGTFGEEQNAGFPLPDISKLEVASTIIPDNGILIKYSLLPETSQPKLKVYDCQGRLIREWRLDSFKGEVEWDGNDLNHHKISAGVYFVRLETGDFKTECKVIKLR